MAIAYLALGSNLGDREGYIHWAIRELKARRVETLKVSSIIETDPVGGPVQPKYLNAVIKVSTSYAPEELLIKLHEVENRLGRIRKVFNGPRVIDLDILLYDDLKFVSRTLVIPHPRMLERDFVMKPLKEIDPKLCALLER